jgi:hypothetical protein
MKAAAKALAEVRLNVASNGDELVVTYPGSPKFRIVFVAAPYVGVEATEIATGNQHAAALLPCDVRFEVLFDEIDAALDEFNTLVLIQEALEKATGGFLFNTWNGEFPGATCNP